MENLILPNVSQRPRLTRAQWDLPVTSVSADAVKEKRHLDDIKEKRWPNLGGLLRPSSETNWRTVPQLTYKGMAMQASEAVAAQKQELGAGGRKWARVALTESHRALTNGALGGSDCTRQRACTPASGFYQLSGKHTTFYLFPQRFCLPWKKKELIKAVKTQGLPGVASLPSPEVFKYRLHNRSVGTTSIPCERD